MAMLMIRCLGFLCAANSAELMRKQFQGGASDTMIIKADGTLGIADHVLEGKSANAARLIRRAGAGGTPMQEAAQASGELDAGGGGKGDEGSRQEVKEASLISEVDGVIHSVRSREDLPAKAYLELTKNISRESVDAFLDETSDEKDHAQRSLLTKRLDGRRRRRRKGVKKIGKKFKKSTKKVSKSVKKEVKNSARTTSKALVDAAKETGKLTGSALNKMKDSVKKVGQAAAKYANDIADAIMGFVKCFNLQKLMLLLMFDDNSGVDIDKSEVIIGLSNNPKLTAKIAPTLGSNSWKYEGSKNDVDLEAEASATFSPILKLSVEPISGKQSLEFSGEVVIEAAVVVSAEKDGERTVEFEELIPKKPKAFTGCVPAFCITLMVQLFAKIEVVAELAGTAEASVTAKYKVSGEVDLDIFQGEGSAKVSAGKLTHSETINYESTFKGTVTLTAGPVFTVLPTPGAPITLEPLVQTEIKAYAQSNDGKQCGKAGINISPIPSVNALGLPGDEDFDSGALEEDITEEIADLPTKMYRTVAGMLAKCAKIPGASSLQSSLEGVMKKASKLISDAVPDFKQSFGKVAKLFEKKFCFNVLKLYLPTSADKCGDEDIGC